MTLGRELMRELSRRGERGDYFTTREYWTLRRIDSVDALADFLDRIGYSHVRASEDVSVIADDLAIAGRGHSTFSTNSPLDFILAPLQLMLSLRQRIGYDARMSYTNRS